MTVRLTLSYRTSNAVVTKDYPNAVEARRELLRRSQLFEGGSWMKGSGVAGQLVDVAGRVKLDYSIKEVTA